MKYPRSAFATGVVVAACVVGFAIYTGQPPVPSCDVRALVIGTPAADLLAACGKPKRINISMSSYDKAPTEQWVYSIDAILYVRGGVLKSWQWQQ